MNALEIIKTDLAEFKTTMANDMLMEGNSLLGGAVSFLKSNDDAITNDEENKDKNKALSARVSETGTNSIQERYKQELLALQSNQLTFLDEPPVSSKPDFSQWQSEFDAESYKTRVSELLIENSSMRLLYAQLVPAQLSNNQFWSRYFYKVAQLDEEHRKRMKLLERVAESNTSNLTDNAANKQSENLDWEDENGKKMAFEFLLFDIR
jgi:hypothetical protein